MKGGQALTKLWTPHVGPGYTNEEEGGLEEKGGRELEGGPESRGFFRELVFICFYGSVKNAAGM
jgi:hypothetical protein